MSRISHPEHGFTLIESLVALCLFGIVSLGLAGGMELFMSFNTLNEQKSGAIMAAQQVLDSLRVEDPVSLPASGTTTQTVPVGGRTYSVAVSYCNPSTHCTTGNIRALRVQVSYRNKQLYSVDTVYAQLR